MQQFHPSSQSPMKLYSMTCCLLTHAWINSLADHPVMEARRRNCPMSPAQAAGTRSFELNETQA
eukprot:11246181-Prorocentrum_lima.AAC.1